MSQNCRHQFGYLSQRSEGEEIPEACMLCEKLLECMRSKPKSTPVASQPESVDIVVKDDLLAQKSQTQRLDEIGKSHANSIENVRIESVPAKSPENQFIVENLGIMYASWTNTVRIDRRILSEWGGKIKEVEIETGDGRTARSKVMPMEESEGKIIQIPDKIQTQLKIDAGDTVIVKPLEGSQKETKITAIIKNYARSILPSR